MTPSPSEPVQDVGVPGAGPCGGRHEVDESLCDLAADVRAATPSNAAQLLFPDKHEVRRQLELRMGNVSEMIQRQIKERRTTDRKSVV